MAGSNDLLGAGISLKTPGLGDAIGGSSNKDLMADARTALSGNWGMAVLGYVLYAILIFSFYAFVFSSAFFVGFVSETNGGDSKVAGEAIKGFAQLIEFLVSGALMVGLCSFFLGITQDRDARLENLFTGFRRFWKSLGTYFFYSVFVFLWALLLIIPGIIASFRYAMAFYIIADDEDCGPLEAISRSKEMMKGNKWKYFCLNWRFFWWGLLCMIIPIGMLWLVPYMQTSFAQFYEDVK